MTLYPIGKIQLDTSIQARATIDTPTVEDYADQMTEGVTFPPVVLFGGEHGAWIGDGWHRVLAAKQVGFSEIAADLRRGGRPQAIEHAIGANQSHGLKRTNADKRRAVEMALEAWPDLSSREIAKRVGVSDPFVGGIRDQLLTVSSSKRNGADGKTRLMPTKRPAAPPADDPDNMPGFREGDFKDERTFDDPDDDPANWPDEDQDEVDGGYAELCAAWTGADETARERFLEYAGLAISQR